MIRSVFASCIIAGVTIVLAIFNVYLWRATKKSAEAAQKAAEALLISESAHVFAKIAYETSRASIYENSKIMSIGVWFNNYGHTPAMVRKIRAYADPSVVIDPTKLLEDVTHTDIPPGLIIESRMSNGQGYRVLVETIIAEDKWNKIISGDARLLCMGLIIYEDVFGIVKETGFCWEFYPDAGGFNISNNNYLNYRK